MANAANRGDYQGQTTSQLLAILEHRDVPDLKAALIDLLCFQDTEREHRRVHGVQFLDLPPEIRICIYEMVAREEGSYPFKHPELMHISRQLRMETGPVLYSTSSYHLGFYGKGNFTRTPMKLRTAGADLWNNLNARGVLHLVRHLHLFLVFDKRSQLLDRLALGYDFDLAPDSRTYSVKCRTDFFAIRHSKDSRAMGQQARVAKAIEDLMDKVVARSKEQKWLEDDMEDLGHNVW